MFICDSNEFSVNAVKRGGPGESNNFGCGWVLPTWLALLTSFSPFACLLDAPPTWQDIWQAGNQGLKRCWQGSKLAMRCGGKPDWRLGDKWRRRWVCSLSVAMMVKWRPGIGGQVAMIVRFRSGIGGEVEEEEGKRWCAPSQLLRLYDHMMVRYDHVWSYDGHILSYYGQIWSYDGQIWSYDGHITGGSCRGGAACHFCSQSCQGKPSQRSEWQLQTIWHRTA